ncbi:MAG TPA: hypothetical protein VHZ07_22830 [Bryobacteraceae bacterium]|jgi:hypothetical protein|nr:hypothetical protein [Bryobacteraceae bacterium]
MSDKHAGRLIRLAAFGTLSVTLSFSGFAQDVHDHNPAGAKVFLISRDLEMRLAVNALPKALREDASILVMEKSGYVPAKSGTNPFTCMVSRRGGNFYPVCFDREGSRTIMRAFADDGVMRLNGMSNEEVERKLAEGFAGGKYRPPSRPGIAYMLSPAIYMLSNGKLKRGTPPHTMFYAPYLTDADVGGIMGKTAFIDRPGPHGMFIVVAGQKEREAMMTESQELLNEVDRQVQIGLEESAALPLR